MAVTGLLPYDINNLLAGAARCVITDDSVALPAIPAKINDVINLKSVSSNYGPKTGFLDVGATADASAYTRDLAASEYRIEQTGGPVFQDITETNRSLRINMAELKPEWLKIMEEGAAITTVAAVAGTNTAQKAVKFGTVVELTKRRVCFIGRRPKAAGLVDEGAGVTRGRFVMLVLYNVNITADAAEISLGKGNLASMPITFRAFPEDGQPSGQEFGTWLDEQAGTI